MGFVKIVQHEFHNCLHYYRKERLNSIEMDYLLFTLLFRYLQNVYCYYSDCRVYYCQEPKKVVTFHGI